jgi:hypothetical protein
MSRNIVMAIALLSGILAEFTIAEVPGKMDYQKTADNAEWTFDNSLAGIPGTMVGWHSAYDVDCLYKHASDVIRITILKDEKKAYSWVGCRWSVFQIVDDRLYYADFTLGDQAGIVAIDLTTGKELWRSKLIGLSTQPALMEHSPAVLMMNLSVNVDVVTICGREMGRYIEFKDIKTGKTVGHKIFPAPLATRPAQ